MGLPLLEKDLAYISKLDTYPTDVGGMSAEELKAAFDAASQDIQNYINRLLIPQIESDIDAASQGVPSGEGINGSRLVENSVPDSKIINLNGDKIDNGTIGTEKHEKGSITRELLSEDAKTVQTEDFPNKVVPGRALEDNTIPFTKYGDGSITAEKVNADSRTQYFSATLTVDGWTGDAAPYTQTVNVGGVVALDRPKVYLVPPETFADVEAAEEAYGLLYDVNSGSGTATFKAKEKPTVAINVALEVNRI